MSRCARDWTREDVCALRELADCWDGPPRERLAPSRQAIQRVQRIAADVETSLQNDNLTRVE